MTTFAVQRLDEGVRATLAAHFLALPLKDRSLRFGAALAPRVIAAYVDGIDFVRDAVFGVHDDRELLVGAAHVAFEGDLAEVGLSVLPAHRGRGVGAALFRRAMAHAQNRRIARFFMHFFSGNAPVMHIAQRFGMDIVTRSGDVDAHLKLPPASLVSIAGEFVMDTLALYDSALRRLVARWRHPRQSGNTQDIRHVLTADELDAWVAHADAGNGFGDAGIPVNEASRKTLK
jgi:GNAT superfamily N-acetyltransferase